MSWENAGFHRKLKKDLLDELAAFPDVFSPVRTGNADRDMELLKAAYREQLEKAVDEIKALRKSIAEERSRMQATIDRLEDALRSVSAAHANHHSAWLHS